MQECQSTSSLADTYRVILMIFPAGFESRMGSQSIWTLRAGVFLPVATQWLFPAVLNSRGVSLKTLESAENNFGEPQHAKHSHMEMCSWDLHLCWLCLEMLRFLTGSHFRWFGKQMSQGMCADPHRGVLWSCHWSIPPLSFTAAQISFSGLGVIHLAVLCLWQGNRQALPLGESWPFLGEKQECWPAHGKPQHPWFVLPIQPVSYGCHFNPEFQKIPSNKSLGKGLWAGCSSLWVQVKLSGW